MKRNKLGQFESKRISIELVLAFAIINALIIVKLSIIHTSAILIAIIPLYLTIKISKHFIY